MRQRTRLAFVLIMTLAAGCAEGAEREEGEDDEAVEAGEEAGTALAASIELPVALIGRTRVTLEAAMATAQAAVAGGTIIRGELEEEGGALIYSFDLRVRGQAGIEEVHVDAVTGEVIAREHEDEGAGEAQEEDVAR